MEDFRRVIKSVDENTQAHSRALLGEDFIKDPTDVFRQWIARNGLQSNDPLWSGRLAMALEIMTLQRLLDYLQLESEHEQTISVLQTLLQDQGIAEAATQWYERLSEWRRVKIVRADEHVPSERASPSGGPDEPS
jgi:hypothetical protein